MILLHTRCIWSNGGAFYNTGIKSIIFPESLKHIKSYGGGTLKRGAFSKSKLETIKYYSKNNIVTIDVYAFAPNSLLEFDIGPKLETITGVTFESSSPSFTRFTANHLSGDSNFKVSTSNI